MCCCRDVSSLFQAKLERGFVSGVVTFRQTACSGGWVGMGDEVGVGLEGLTEFHVGVEKDKEGTSGRWKIRLHSLHALLEVDLELLRRLLNRHEDAADRFPSRVLGGAGGLHLEALSSLLAALHGLGELLEGDLVSLVERE